MLQCEKCGLDDSSELEFFERRRERHQEILCRSCLARPVRSVKTAYGICRPHRGAFDQEENPLDRWGRLFRPGLRLCGYRDCIEPSHVVPMKG